MQYWILHKRGCNNVFISAEAILHMRTTCYCAMLLYYFKITTRLKQAPVNIETWSEQHSSCYTALLSLKKTAKLPKRRLPFSLKKSRFADVPTETLALLACDSMPENSARNSKYHCNTTIQGVNQAQGMYQTSRIYRTGGAFEVWLQWEINYNTCTSHVPVVSFTVFLIALSTKSNFTTACILLTTYKQRTCCTFFNVTTSHIELMCVCLYVCLQSCSKV